MVIILLKWLREKERDTEMMTLAIVVAACACVSYCLLLYWLLECLYLLRGIHVWSASMSRKRRYDVNVRYNTRAKQWVQEGIPTFGNASFTFSGTNLIPVTTTSGNYYPVRDTCSKKGDPEEKCVYTNAYYYSGLIPLDLNRFHASLYSNNHSIVSEYYDNSITKYYTPSDLGCSKDTSKCASKCSNKGGEWSSSSRQCTVTKYLSEVCYRLALKNGVWALDSPP